MLVLTRRSGESIIISDHITITLLAIEHNRVKLGIDAPIDITVHRKEIYDRIKQGQSYFNLSKGE